MARSARESGIVIAMGHQCMVVCTVLSLVVALAIGMLAWAMVAWTRMLRAMRSASTDLHVSKLLYDEARRDVEGR